MIKCEVLQLNELRTHKDVMATYHLAIQFKSFKGLKSNIGFIYKRQMYSFRVCSMLAVLVAGNSANKELDSWDQIKKDS